MKRSAPILAAGLILAVSASPSLAAQSSFPGEPVSSAAAGRVALTHVRAPLQLLPYTLEPDCLRATLPGLCSAPSRRFAARASASLSDRIPRSTKQRGRK